jgi:hypothetical protein
MRGTLFLIHTRNANCAFAFSKAPLPAQRSSLVHDKKSDNPIGLTLFPPLPTPIDH